MFVFPWIFFFAFYSCAGSTMCMRLLFQFLLFFFLLYRPWMKNEPTKRAMSFGKFSIVGRYFTVFASLLSIAFASQLQKSQTKNKNQKLQIRCIAIHILHCHRMIKSFRYSKHFVSACVVSFLFFFALVSISFFFVLFFVEGCNVRINTNSKQENVRKRKTE